MTHQKQQQNVEHFSYLGSMTTNDLRCSTHVKLNPGLPWQKQDSARRMLFSPENWT
jgi:hypothetical protein